MFVLIDSVLIQLTAPGEYSTLMPVDGGGCFILKRHESMPVFLAVRVKEYVDPSRRTPKSIISGDTSKPLMIAAPPPNVEEVRVLRRTGSSTVANCGEI